MVCACASNFNFMISFRPGTKLSSGILSGPLSWRILRLASPAGISKYLSSDKFPELYDLGGNEPSERRAERDGAWPSGSIQLLSLTIVTIINPHLPSLIASFRRNDTRDACGGGYTCDLGRLNSVQSTVEIKSLFFLFIGILHQLFHGGDHF